LGIQVTVNRDRTAVKTSLQTPEISNCKYIPVASIASLHINSQTKVITHGQIKIQRLIYGFRVAYSPKKMCITSTAALEMEQTKPTSCREWSHVYSRI